MDHNKNLFQSEEESAQDGSYTFTTWKNETQNTAVLKLQDLEEDYNYVSKKNPAKGTMEKKPTRKTGNGKWITRTIKPGESVQLPRHFDNAIQTLDLSEDPITGKIVGSGTVIGGACPWLTKVGDEDRVVADFLDWETDVAVQEIEKMSKAIERSKAREMKLQKINEQRKLIEATYSELKTANKTAKEKK